MNKLYKHQKNTDMHIVYTLMLLKYITFVLSLNLAPFTSIVSALL